MQPPPPLWHGTTSCGLNDIIHLLLGNLSWQSAFSPSLLIHEAVYSLGNRFSLSVQRTASATSLAERKPVRTGPSHGANGEQFVDISLAWTMCSHICSVLARVSERFINRQKGWGARGRAEGSSESFGLLNFKDTLMLNCRCCWQEIVVDNLTQIRHSLLLHLLR